MDIYFGDISVEMIFGLLSGKLIFSLFLRLPERKVLDPNGPHIDMRQIKIIIFIFEIHLHQSFTDCVSKQITSSGMSTC